MNIGQIVHKLETCTSTNDAARVFAEDGFEEGLVVLAESQLSGRGTKGRSWFSSKGQGLYLSVVLRPEDRSPALLPFVAGLALREAILASTGLDVRLKWPNDLTLEGRKLAGILCESSWSGSHLNFVILGLGLNVGHEEADFPEDLRGTATSLRLALGKPPDKASLVQAIYLGLNRWYDVFRAGRDEEIVRGAEAAMSLGLGSKVTLETVQGAVTGVFRGLRPDGSLVLKSGGKESLYKPSDVRAVRTD